MPRRTVDLADLTLDELDAVEALRRESGCGYTVAAVTVHGRRDDPALDVDTVRAMRSGDVSVIDTTGDDDPGPTPAP